MCACQTKKKKHKRDRDKGSGEKRGKGGAASVTPHTHTHTQTDTHTRTHTQYIYMGICGFLCVVRMYVVLYVVCVCVRSDFTADWDPFGTQDGSGSGGGRGGGGGGGGGKDDGGFGADFEADFDSAFGGDGAAKPGTIVLVVVWWRCTSSGLRAVGDDIYVCVCVFPYRQRRARRIPAGSPTLRVRLPSVPRPRRPSHDPRCETGLRGGGAVVCDGVARGWCCCVWRWI